MFWKRRARKKQPPGPTGTGMFYNVLDWWLWDDDVVPGLLTREKFQQLSDLALPEAERGKYAGALIGSTIVTDGKHSTSALEKRARYFRQMNNYLVDIRERDADEINDWVCRMWLSIEDERRFEEAGIKAHEYGERVCFVDQLFDVFKAYISVLEFWNYPYSWEEILDARAEPALLILYDSKPAHCVLKNDIQSISGLPFEFSLDTNLGAIHKSSTWWFSVHDPELRIVTRLGWNDDIGESMVRRHTVGSNDHIPTNEIEEFWPMPAMPRR